MNRKCFFVVFILVLIFSSCKTQRTVVKAPIKEYGSDYIFNKMKENELRFETISMKAEINAKINRKKSKLSATLRIQRDSMIWVSISPGLGLEAARILITQDSLFFMNRINKEYFSSDFSYIASRFKVDVDFNMLQSLLLGCDFSNYENDKFRAAYDANDYRLIAAERSKQKKYIRNNNDAQRVLVQSVWLDSDNFKINQIRIRSLFDETRKLEVFYGDFENTNNQLFPTNVIFEIVARGNAASKKGNETKTENQKIQIKLDFSKIAVNESVAMPFNIPAKYQKMMI